MKPVVLFVDDEPNILSALKRYTRTKRDSWDIHFFDGGQAALDFLQKNHVDAIVSDMRMPGIDGAALLEHISKKWPGIIRIILSGEAATEQTYRTVGRSHQFLAKPCSPEALLAAIQAPLDMRDDIGINGDMQNASLLDRMQTPQSVLDEFESLLRNQASLKDIAQLVSRDPNLAVRTLQVVNSAYFGRPIKTCNIARAVEYMGHEKLLELLNRKRFGNNGEPYISTPADLMRIEADCMLAERAANYAKANYADADEIDACYAAGLFCNLAIDAVTNDNSAPTNSNLASSSAAFATALMGLPAHLTFALISLSILSSHPDDMSERARLICETVLDTTLHRGEAHDNQDARITG